MAAVCFGAPASGADGKPMTATGWFADDACAMGRAKSGTYTATNPTCALRCIKKGAKLVFIAEQQKALWTVAAPNDYVGHIGEYVKISGALDEGSGVMQIESVTTLDKVRPSCERKKNPSASPAQSQ
jgi:hypothetical protein